MKLERYLNEMSDYEFDEVQDQWNNQVLPTLKRDCGQFIKEANHMLYRGVSDKHKDIGAMKKFNVRKERRPMDTPTGIQKSFDKEAFKQYKWKPRSEGVFVSPRSSQAGGYGKIYMFFPIDGYKYLWAPDIPDFYDKWTRDIKQDTREKSDKDDWWEDFINQYYTNNGMAYNSNNEMMFHCPKGYYLVDGDFLEALLSEFNLRR